jgi:Abnormal spindle-like microcephaly-assoc'd, ASPM-SPD-2-Hydin/Bacterial Ig-like domain (group 1)
VFSLSPTGSPAITSYTFVGSDAGVKTLYVTFKTETFDPNTYVEPYFQTVTATDASASVSTASQEVNVNPGPAATITPFYPTTPIFTPTIGATVGFNVAVHDAFGNSVLGEVVTVAAPTTGPSVVIPPAVYLVNSSGSSYVVVYANQIAGGPYSMTVTAADLPNSPLTYTVTNFRDATTTGLTGSPASPIAYGTGIALTATVRPMSPSGSNASVARKSNPLVNHPQTSTALPMVSFVVPNVGPPTGTVQFWDTVGSAAPRLLGTSTIGGASGASPNVLGGVHPHGPVGGPATTPGMATFSIAVPAGGTHSYTATYLTDGNFLGSTTAVALPYIVNQVPVTLSGPAQAVEVPAGQGGLVPVTVTGSVSGAGIAVPSGSLSYTILNSSNVSVGSGSASLTVGNSSATTSVPISATLAPGSYTMTSSYDGDNNFAASSSPFTLLFTVSVVSNLTFNNTSFVFGSVPVGITSPTQTLIIVNPNGFAVTGVTVAASGDFSAFSNCPTISALGACSINIAFTPTAAGARTGSLRVTDAQSSVQMSASLTGSGTAAGIQFTPASLNFGGVLINTSSFGQTITIQNTGTADLIISNIASTGDFITTGNCAVVPAGSNCSLSVTFTPTAAGARTGTVTLTDNVGGSSQNQVVGLSGMGTRAGATLTPGVATFPSTLLGSTSFLDNATLTNTGTAPLTGIGLSTLGDFTQTNTCQSTLAAGASCTISVSYAPTIAGAESGTLTVTDNLGAQSVSLVGTGVVPGVSLSSSQLIFGGQQVNGSSLAQTVIFTNTGSTAVNIGSVAIAGNFTDTTNCTGSIAAGASCSVNVIFTPITAGPLSGTVTMSDGAGTQMVTLKGQGTNPGLAVSPSFEIFGAQVAGTTSQAQTVTVTNTGTVTLTLVPITVSNDFFASSQCPATFSPGATCTISLSFSPTSTGTLAGSLVISDAGGLVSTLVTATGQGTLPGIATSPSTLSFGSLSVGTTSQGQTVTVTNSGAAPLPIGTVSGIGDFAESDTCSLQTIPAGGYCVISVTMTPTTVGTRTGAIQFNSAGGQRQIALSGVGQKAGVSVSPTSLAFGSAPIVSSAQVASAAGTSLSVTVSNTGSTPLVLSGFTTQGDFSEADNCGASVAVGATCTLTVKFVPTALGHRTGTLTTTDNAGGGSQTVSLAGDGSPAGLILTPPVIDFGVQPKSVTSKAHTATLSNNTGQAITDLLILASGEYSETDTCGTALANGATCTLNITVTPATTGAITGTVVISGGGVFANTPSSVKTSGESVANGADSSSSSNVGVVATLADTNGNATAVQLAFGLAPTPVIAAGGNVGSYITVLENDSNGNMVGATDTITLTVTSPSGTATTYTATASGGIATFNLSGNALTAAGAYKYSVAVASNASIKPAAADVTVNAGVAASVVPTAGSGQSSLTNVAFGTPLQVVVADSYGNPVSGVTVTFAAPAAGASATLSSNTVKTGSAGTASITATANGTAGVYTVTAAASGATLASFSLTNTAQSGVDFSLNPGSVNGQGPSQTVIPGGTATYSLVIVPTSGTTLPASTTLTITGMPAGATASVPTSPWTPLASNSWSFPANTSFTGFSLTIQPPSATALLNNKDVPARKFPPVLWGILLLPFVGGMRRISKRLGKTVSILMVMVVGLTAAVALSGCGSSNGFFGQPQKTYTVTVTATSGTLSHSTNLTLTVE